MISHQWDKVHPIFTAYSLLIQLSFSKNPALAGKFIDFVASPEGQAVFRKYGFLDNRQHR